MYLINSKEWWRKILEGRNKKYVATEKLFHVNGLEDNIFQKSVLPN